MPTIGHPLVGAALGRHLPVRRWQGAVLGAALAWLPDLDAVGYALGVPYGAEWGHRGATHAPAFAALVALALALPVAWRRGPALRVGLVAFLAVASHGLLDAMTDGGRGVALGWPFTDARFFLPWRPIPVGPIGLRGLWGGGVLRWELLHFLPLAIYAAWPRAASRGAAR